MSTVNSLHPAALLAFMVDGAPVQQGSKRIGRTKAGKPIILDDNDVDLSAWREAVAWRVRAAMRGREPITEASRVGAVFTVPRPRTVTRLWPSVKPDLDKYIRALFDAIKDGGGWRDDALAVEVTAVKSYPGVHRDSLPKPGVVVRIWPVLEPIEETSVPCVLDEHDACNEATAR